MPENSVLHKSADVLCLGEFLKVRFRGFVVYFAVGFVKGDENLNLCNTYISINLLRHLFSE